MNHPSYDTIARAGGAYDTRKYRYIIDTTTREIKRAKLEDLDTTAMLEPGAWVTVLSPQYRVLPEYLDQWTTEPGDCIVDLPEIRRLAREWGVPLEELMQQVEEV